MTDKELKDLVASLAIESKATDKQIKELRFSQNKTDEQIKELRFSQNKTDEQIKELRFSQNKTDEQINKTDKKINKLDEMGKRWDNFLGNYGESVEEYFYRSLDKEKTLGKLKFDDIKRNIRKTDRSVEYDIILVNGDSIGIIEVKNKAHPKDIKPLIQKKINHFKLDYPEYENYKYYFGIATMITNEEIIKQAQNEGIFLLTQDANHLELIYEGYSTF